MKRLSDVAYSIGLILIFAQSGVALSQDSWPLFRGDAHNRGVADVELAEAPTLAWRFETQRAIKSTPVIGDGRVFIGSDDNNIYALDLHTGEKIWSYETQDSVEAAPALVGDSVVAGSNDGVVYRLHAQSGSLLWKFETLDKVIGSVIPYTPSSDDGVWLIFGSYDNHLYCIDFDTGEEIWKYATDNYINGSPALWNDKLILGGCDSLIHVVSAESGEAIFEHEIDAYIAASMAIDEQGRAYIGHYGNEFMCLDLNEGETTWVYRYRNFPYFSSAAIGASQVVFGGRDRQVHSVDRATGEQLWTFRTRGQVDSSPVICRDKVVVGSKDGNLYILRLEDGEELWSYPIGQSITGSPAVVREYIVIGAEDGFVYAFSNANE